MTDVDDQFAAIDAALESTGDAIDQEDQAAALAGLFGAVTGINALATPTPVPVVIPAGAEYRGGGPSIGPSSMRGILGRDRGDVDPAKLQERLGKVLASVQKIVDKFGSDSFTVSAGFPLGVNVSLTWNPTKKVDSVRRRSRTRSPQTCESEVRKTYSCTTVVGMISSHEHRHKPRSPGTTR